MTIHYEAAQTNPAEAQNTRPSRKVMRSLLRGATNRCMNCGKSTLFERFLKNKHACTECGEEFHHHRADDAPPYFTITIVGHIIIPALLVVEMLWLPPLWLHMVIWIPLTLLLSICLMQPVKGALIGLQWALYMHGFDPEATDEIP